MPLNEPSPLLDRGYEIVPAEKMEPLIALREKVFRKARELVDGNGQDAESFLNAFHRRGLEGARLNDVRVRLVDYCTTNLGAGRAIFEAFRGYFLSLLGPDIVVQKTTNLVIQQPGDRDQVPTHRDSPLNSPFEIVVWIPLVDVYGTKGMHVLDRKRSAEAVKLLSKPEPSYGEYSLFAKKHGIELDMPFGSALFFWPGLVHGCWVNREKETRWSLNIRYKQLFSPYYSKGPGDFFEVFQISPLTRTALDFEKEKADESEAPLQK